MTQGEAYDVLCAVDDMFDDEVGVAWSVHTSKVWAVGSRPSYIRADVPWPPKWGRRV